MYKQNESLSKLLKEKQNEEEKKKKKERCCVSKETAKLKRYILNLEGGKLFYGFKYDSFIKTLIWTMSVCLYFKDTE